MPPWTKIDIAYSSLGCDPSTSDEDVVAACYSRRPSSGLGSYYSNDLEIIAEERKSRFLLFISSIYRHLNDENVAILAKKRFVMFAVAEAEPDTPESSQLEEALLSWTDTEGDGNGVTCETLGETLEAKSSELKSPSSSEAEIMSSIDDVSMDSEFEEEGGGIYFGNTSWRCEDCSCSIVNGVCPNGHDLRRCIACECPLVDDLCPRCQKICETCGMGTEGGESPCCASDGEEDLIVSDNTDGVWRCVYCQWEVEADNETDGNCHCLNPMGEARYLDLSECLDYKPADSDSSHDESSSDEEPDSEDEGFIDDETVTIEGVFDRTTEITNLDQITALIRGTNPIKREAKVAKAMIAAEDKENMEPDPSSDVEIVDGPDVGTSNFVDIESMNM